MASHSATKEEFMKIFKQINSVYFSDIIGFWILGSHFHLLVKRFPGHQFNDEEIKNRFARFYGNEAELGEDKIDQYREKWSNLSELIKEIKQQFSKFYNKRHNRRGTLWGERFKSVIVEEGGAMINCLAYIDLNPVQGDIVKKPEDYRWSLLGYHIQSYISNQAYPVRKPGWFFVHRLRTDGIQRHGWKRAIKKISAICVWSRVVEASRQTISGIWIILPSLDCLW